MAAAKKHLELLEEKKIKRSRNHPEHITNCKDGYTPSLSFLWQAHHMLPISALNYEKHISAQGDNLIFIENCLRLTEWNINAEPNMIGLDTKWPYKLYPFHGLPPNLPSHLIGHGDYTKESYEYMEANVWDTLKDAREIHKLDPYAIAGQLNAASKYFEGVLRSRGMREGGTIRCWRDRWDEGMEATWYMPFSMSDSPRKRHRGIPNAMPWLDKLFSAIK